MKSIQPSKGGINPEPTKEVLENRPPPPQGSGGTEDALAAAYRDGYKKAEAELEAKVAEQQASICELSKTTKTRAQKISTLATELNRQQFLNTGLQHKLTRIKAMLKDDALPPLHAARIILQETPQDTTIALSELEKGINEIKKAQAAETKGGA